MAHKSFPRVYAERENFLQTCAEKYNFYSRYIYNINKRNKTKQKY